MIYLFLRCLQLLLRPFFWLPPVFGIAVMRFAARLTYEIALMTRLKGTIAGNIRLIFPKADTERLAGELLKNISRSIFEILCIPYFRSGHLKRTADLVGLDRLALVLSQGKGAIILTMHSGNYELLPAMLADRGYRPNSILKATSDPLFRLVNRSRAYRGGKLINILEADMYRESLKALARNEPVVLLADTGALEGRHEYFPFLGRKVPAATGWLTLAQRSEAAVLPLFSMRVKDKVVFTFGEPLHVHHDDREEAMKKAGLFFEGFIKAHPEQWAIFLNTYEVERMMEMET